MGEAREQLLMLPSDMLDDLSVALAGIQADPWNFQRQPDEADDDHHAHRAVSFGDGGVLTYLIIDREAMIYVTSITWVG